MRLKEQSNFNASSNLTDMTLFFANSLGESLDSKQLQALGYSGKFYNVLYDSKENVAGYIFRGDNLLLGVYDTKGKLFAPFLYTEIQHVNANYVSLGMLYEIFICKKVRDVCDIYYGTKKVFDDVEEFNIPIDNTNNKAGRYLIVSRSRSHYIYDFNLDGIITHISCDCITAIHTNFQRIICKRKDGYNNATYYVEDFSGNILGKSNYEISFTETKGFYTIHSDYTEVGIGCESQNSKELEIIADTIYYDVRHVLSDKAVIINNGPYTQFELISYNKNFLTWNRKTELLDADDEFQDIKIFENEDDAILCFKDSREMLLSHYLQDSTNENFYCTHISYEGHGIFKCFHNEYNSTSTEITYIYSGQAINYKSKKKSCVNIVEDIDKNNTTFLMSNGKICLKNNHVNVEKINMWNKRLNYSFDNDFMTIEPEGMKNLPLVYSSSKSSLHRDYVINEITGELYEFDVRPSMVWHNLFLVEGTLHLMENGQNYKKTSPKNIIATFNDYIVLKHNGFVYVCDKDFNIQLELLCDCYVDIMNRLVVLRNISDMAYTVSNNGIEYFKFQKEIKNKSIYKSIQRANYIIEDMFVSEKVLKDDLYNGVIDDDFSVLV